MKEKIGLVLRSKPSNGGMFQYSITIVDALLAQKRHDLAIEIFYFDSIWEKVLTDIDIPKTCISKNLLWSIVGKLNDSARLKLRFFTDLLFRKSSFNEIDNWIFPSQDALSFQIPGNAIVSVHDLMHRYETSFPEVGNNQEYNFREFLYSNICHKAKAVLVDSELGKKQLLESYPFVDKKRVFILPFVPRSSIYNDVNCEQIKLKFNLPDKFVFYPAQFWRHKNHISLVKAVDLVYRENPDIVLVLVGYRNEALLEVERFITEKQLTAHIKIIDYVSDDELTVFYKLARAMIMPSYFGPTNIPPLEAMALGCPVAVANNYAMVAQIGNAGLSFSPENINEIAGCIEKLWNNDELCRCLSKNGLKQIADNYTQEIFNVKFNEILEIVLSRNDSHEKP
ncbi:MAG: glycosyltransferase family 1 protein [Bacillota bacterium]